jgi:beta-lactamase superfamily II metal-dependent hydrolase
LLLSDPPKSDELEVSIFGPGKGEAIAVHLGGGDWITVDSCRSQSKGTHSILDYFEAIGVNIEQQLKVVVGTHAHDDHIAGLGQLYESAKNAIFVCSAAAASEEFLVTAEADKSVAAGLRSSVRREYLRILDEVERRGRERSGFAPLKRAVESLPLWTRSSTPGRAAAEIVALSPSHVAVTRAQRDLATSALAAPNGTKRFANRDPNEFAVALWVSVGSQRILLGADLLSGPAGCGWQAVLANVSVSGKAGIFKVPHHGSITSHHDGVWAEMLEVNPVALIAPFRGGRKHLPSPADLARICALTNSGYVTASPERIAQRESTRRISASLGGVASNVRDPWGTPGHVRARKGKDDAPWHVEMFGPAMDLATALKSK